MAQSPLMSAAMPAAGAGMMPPDPGADPSAAGDADADSDDNVVCTICSDGQGGYVIYSGDEPESGGAGDTDDGSEDDADAMGPAGDAPAGGASAMGGGGASDAQGQPADSLGAALKIVMTILQSAQSSQGAPGNADSQFAAGFSASKSPTPVSGPMSQKY
jgi:hypothetical protein